MESANTKGIESYWWTIPAAIVGIPIIGILWRIFLLGFPSYD